MYHLSIHMLYVSTIYLKYIYVICIEIQAGTMHNICQTLGLDSDIRFIKVGTRSSTQKIDTAPVKPPIFHPDGPWSKLPIIHPSMERACLYIRSVKDKWNTDSQLYPQLHLECICIICICLTPNAPGVGMISSRFRPLEASRVAGGQPVNEQGKHEEMNGIIHTIWACTSGYFWFLHVKKNSMGLVPSP